MHTFIIGLIGNTFNTLLILELRPTRTALNTLLLSARTATALELHRQCTVIVVNAK